MRALRIRLPAGALRNFPDHRKRRSGPRDAVQVPQHFQRPNLPALRRGMQEIVLTQRIFIEKRRYPSKADRDGTLAGNENISPDLQIQQPPDAIGRIFDTGSVTLEQCIELVASVEQGSEQSIADRAACESRSGTLGASSH